MLLSLFTYDFMVNALVAGTAMAIIAPAIGLFLVTRRYSFMADTLSHVSLAGVAVGYLTRIEPIVTAMAASVGAALAVEYLRSRRRVLGESSLALFLSGGLGLAAVLLSASQGLNISLSGLLFGSISTVNTNDVRFVLILGAVVVAILILLYRGLFSVSFDEELAISSGLPVTLLNTTLVILAAVTVSLTMRIVGVLLVGALMVIPVITAMQWRRGFLQTLLIGVCFSVAAVWIGLVLSFHLGFASGGTIVLTAIALFLASALATSRS